MIYEKLNFIIFIFYSFLNNKKILKNKKLNYNKIEINSIHIRSQRNVNIHIIT